MKKIIINVDTKIIEEKQRKNRKVTEHSKWEYDNITIEEEIKLVTTCLQNNEGKQETFLIQQIKNKLSSYRSQDKTKKIYNEDKFINILQTLKLLEKQNHLCYYCKECVKLLYSSVREPKQWTLERMDNDFGHNFDNVSIACLNCNLRRRTMYHGRFTATQEIKNVVKIG